MNMKKLVLLLLTLTLVFVSTAALADAHKNGCTEAGFLKQKQATCDTPGWCRHEADANTPGARQDEDGVYFVEYEILPVGHEMVIADTVRKDGRCYNVLACDHVWNGVPCDYTETRDIAHSMKWKVDSDLPVNCEEPATLKYVCEYCGYDSGERSQTEPREHEFGTDKIIDQPGTCQTKEVYHYECVNCGAPSKSYTGDLGGHVYGDLWTEVEATCQKEGKGYRICNFCDALLEEVIPKKDHVRSEQPEVLRLPDCTTQGLAQYYCVNCKEYFTRTEDYVSIPALGHDFSYPVPEWGEDKKPTCTEDGYNVVKCTRCEETTKQTVPALGHDWGDWQERNPATEGSLGYWIRTCKRCFLTETRFSSDNGTTVKVENVVEPTCTTEGKQDNVVYDINGKEIQRETVVTAPALGHDFTVEVTEGAEAATCVTAGKAILKCSRCDVTEEKEVPALGHDMQEVPELTVAATCEAAGKTVAKCSRCDVTEEKEIPALGHKLTSVAAKPATNTTSGNKAYDVCDRCGKLFIGGVEVSMADVIVNANGGLALDANGNFKYYDKNGNVDKSFSGMTSYNGGLFFVRDGGVDKSVNGSQCPDGTWYFFANGQVQNYTGLAEYNGEWFVVNKGRFMLGYNGLYDWNGGTFWIAAGKKTHVNGLEKTEKGWMYFEDGCLIKLTGLKAYDGQIFYVKDGVMQSNFTGTVKDQNGKSFNVVNGMVK